MEPHTDVLEIVCKHFATTYGTKAMSQIKREKSCLASSNYRLRQKVKSLEARIQNLTSQNNRLFVTYRKILLQMIRARHKVVEFLAPPFETAIAGEWGSFPPIVDSAQ